MTMTEDRGFDALMERVCVGLGFCGCIKRERPLHVTDLIPESGPVTADQFTEWVFLADNQNPNVTSPSWLKIKGRVREAFVACMGAEEVDASVLRWNLDPVEKSSA